MAGDPAGMLGRRVPFKLVRNDHPMPAALDRAAPLQPRLPGVVVGEEGGGLAWRMARQRVHISTVNRPSTSLNGPVEVPQNEQCGPTPHLSYSNTCSERTHSGLL